MTYSQRREADLLLLGDRASLLLGVGENLPRPRRGWRKVNQESRELAVKARAQIARFTALQRTYEQKGTL